MTEPDIVDAEPGSLRPYHLASLDASSHAIEVAATPHGSWVKRVFDIAGAVVGLVLLSPLLAVLAVLVKLDSPGPMFFAQTRAGVGGRPFRMYKLRTMRNGADGEKAAVAHLNHTADAVIASQAAFVEGCSRDRLPVVAGMVRLRLRQTGQRRIVLAVVAAHFINHQVQ